MPTVVGGSNYLIGFFARVSRNSRTQQITSHIFRPLSDAEYVVLFVEAREVRCPVMESLVCLFEFL